MKIIGREGIPDQTRAYRGRLVVKTFIINENYSEKNKFDRPYLFEDSSLLCLSHQVDLVEQDFVCKCNLRHR